MNDCPTCGNTIDEDECVGCQIPRRILEQAIGSGIKAHAVMQWVRDVARHQAIRAAKDMLTGGDRDAVQGQAQEDPQVTLLDRNRWGHP